MTIAILVNSIFPFEIGGIQKHSYFLAKGLVDRKIHVDIFQTSSKINGCLKDYFTDEELEYLNFVFVKFPQPIAFPGHYIYASYFFSKRLYKKLNEDKKYDFIYAQGFTSWYFLRKKPFHKNLITNLHGLEMFQPSVNLKHQIVQLLLKIPAKEIIRRSAKQISLGGKLTHILYRVGAKENSVLEIPNAIPVTWLIHKKEIEEANRAEQLHFVFIGRYERRKGIKEFHQVVSQTIDALSYQVSFIGPIPKEKKLNKCNLKYFGLVEDSEKIKAILKHADVLVSPSYSEGMPTVILEAMACGCAIIATDVGANRELVDSENGWLIKGDIRSGLEAAIREAVITSKEVLKQKKINSLNKVRKNFTWNKVIDQTLKEIAKCRDS